MGGDSFAFENESPWSEPAAPHRNRHPPKNPIGRPLGPFNPEPPNSLTSRVQAELDSVRATSAHDLEAAREAAARDAAEVGVKLAAAMGEVGCHN